jgi:Regulator of Chromosome Condensation (RCC1) repeat protein
MKQASVWTSWFGAAQLSFRGSLVATAAQAAGPVVGWGSGPQATPPPTVDGTRGTAVAVTAGDLHSCAIQRSIGQVVCWGDDVDGQLDVPPGLATAGAIAGGESHTLAIASPEPTAAWLGAVAIAALARVRSRAHAR